MTDACPGLACKRGTDGRGADEKVVQELLPRREERDESGEGMQAHVGFLQRSA